MNAADAIILATGSGLFSDFTHKFFLFLSYVWQPMRCLIIRNVFTHFGIAEYLPGIHICQFFNSFLPLFPHI